MGFLKLLKNHPNRKRLPTTPPRPPPRPPLPLYNGRRVVRRHFRREGHGPGGEEVRPSVAAALRVRVF